MLSCPLLSSSPSFADDLFHVLWPTTLQFFGGFADGIYSHVYHCSVVPEPERSDRDSDWTDTIHCSVSCLLVHKEETGEAVSHYIVSHSMGQLARLGMMERERKRRMRTINRGIVYCEARDFEHISFV